VPFRKTILIITSIFIASCTESEKLLLKSRDAIRNSQIEEALTLINTAIDLDSSDPKLFYCRSDIYSIMQDYSKAVKDISAAIRLDSTKTQYYNHKSSLLTQQGLLSEALECNAQSIRIKPTGLGYYTRSKTNLELRDTISAIKDLEAAVVINSNTYMAYNLLGEIHNNKKEFSQAIIQFDKAIHAFIQSGHRGTPYFEQSLILNKAMAYYHANDYKNCCLTINKVTHIKSEPIENIKNIVCNN